MKNVIVLSLVGVLGSAHAAEIYNNGPVVNAGLSVLAAPATTFGFGAQSTAGNSVAEDFTVSGGGWMVQSFDFFGYQTGSTGFTFTTATWSVVSGDVNTGTVVASGTTAVSNGGLLGYRVTTTTLTNTQRGIYRVQTDVPDFMLADGSYWLRWNLAGSLASGPWQPPTSDAAVGNGQQSLASATFATIVEAGSQLGVTLPFAIQGSVVPEPSSLLMLLAGGLAIGAAARRRQPRV